MSCKACFARRARRRRNGRAGGLRRRHDDDFGRLPFRLALNNGDGASFGMYHDGPRCTLNGTVSVIDAEFNLCRSEVLELHDPPAADRRGQRALRVRKRGL
jgi:hypothetical protein